MSTQPPRPGGAGYPMPPAASKPRHPFFGKLRRKAEASVLPEGHRPATWNGHACTAQAGTCVVPPAEKTTYWYAHLTGHRIKCVVVHYRERGEVSGNLHSFVLGDQDGSASRKVFESWGGPDSKHYSLPKECLSTFTPNA